MGRRFQQLYLNFEDYKGFNTHGTRADQVELLNDPDAPHSFSYNVQRTHLLSLISNEDYKDG